MTAAWTAEELEWIGAAEELEMTPIGPVTWGEHVADEQYAGGRSA